MANLRQYAFKALILASMGVFSYTHGCKGEELRQVASSVSENRFVTIMRASYGKHLPPLDCNFYVQWAVHYYNGSESKEQEAEAARKVGIALEKLKLYEDAEIWYIRARDLGDADAAFRHGYMVENGLLCAFGPLKLWTIEAYEKAASKGHIKALYRLGQIYTAPGFNPQYYEKGMACYWKAAIFGILQTFYQGNLSVTK